MNAGPGIGSVSRTPVARFRPRIPGLPTDERVGPNAILQTLAALDELCGPPARNRVLNVAGLGALVLDRPQQMVSVSLVNALNRAILSTLDRQVAERVMRRAGELTGLYILENRIPKLMRNILPRLPGPVSRAILMRAIIAHSWTFAGSARVRASGRRIEIVDNPICLGRAGFAGCFWHAAVFETLFAALVSPDIAVAEIACTGRGDEACRFELV